MIARCSRVCGMTPSSAATTSSTTSMPVAPATIWRTNFSWPGTSTTPIVRPLGRSSRAKPSSMVMPRSFSSGRRSGSVPVSALTSADLPWSMCPAVPRTSDGALAERILATPPQNFARQPRDRRRVLLGGGRQRPRVDQQAVVVDARDDRGSRRSAAAPRAWRRPSVRGATATTALGMSAIGSAPPPARARRRRCTSPSAASPHASRMRAASASARTRTSDCGAVSIAQRGDLAQRALRVEVQPQRRLERGERHLVEAQRRAPSDASSGRAMTSARADAGCPACGPPSSLSPEAETTSAPAAIARADRGLAGKPQWRRSMSTPDPGPPSPARRAARRARTSSASETSSVKPTTGSCSSAP